MKKKYIIVGDNNYWYSTFEASTTEEIDQAIKEARMIIGEFDEPECNELFVYEVAGVLTVKV